MPIRPAEPRTRQNRGGYWKPEMADKVYHLALMGATEKQMANVLGLKLEVISYWKVNKPEFMDALSRGKDEADMEVVKSLYKRALGFDVVETKVFKDSDGEILKTVEETKHILPDVMACLRWLSLRQRDQWAEVSKSEVNVRYSGVVDLTFLQKKIQDRSLYSVQDLKLGLEEGVKQLAAKQIDTN